MLRHHPVPINTKSQANVDIQEHIIFTNEREFRVVSAPVKHKAVVVAHPSYAHQTQMIANRVKGLKECHYGGEHFQLTRHVHNSTLLKSNTRCEPFSLPFPSSHHSWS